MTDATDRAGRVLGAAYLSAMLIFIYLPVATLMVFAF